VPGFALRARPPKPGNGSAEATGDVDILRGYLEDAAHFPGGHARALIAPACESQVAEALRNAAAVLPVGAQSSLTGGATPMGETIVSTHRLTGVELVGPDRVRVGAGVALETMLQTVEAGGRAYPPAPTFRGAFVGGTIATNASGAATFKYGSTRDWVVALTVVLPSGDVLDIERGATHAHPEGYFELLLPSGTVRVPVPGYRAPAVPKLSAGYFAAPQMDLIDLFIGSEGTLGIVTEATLRLLPVRPAQLLAFVPFPDEAAAIAFARILRHDSRRSGLSTPLKAGPSTRLRAGQAGIDVAAIEYMDDRSLAIIREDGADVANGINLPGDGRCALLVTLELAPGTSAAAVYDEIARSQDAVRPDTPTARFCGRLLEAGVFDEAAVAAPGETGRAAQLIAVREAVPSGVNQRIGRASRSIDPRIDKTAADIIVPFERITEFLRELRTESRRCGLDCVVWGHASDGNLHPNVIPRSLDELQRAKTLVADLGRLAIRLGGAPMAEHGVGRNPIKQQLLTELYGEAGIEAMRAVKRAIDPDWKLSPGVIFEP
jgi:D-lactate dehydrogenase (cytochrome)